MTSDGLEFAEVARRHPDRDAVVLGDGRSITYAELDRRSRQFAQVLRDAGVGPGDCIAILLENNLRFHEIAWAAQRSGLYYTAINSHLTVAEAAYIIDNSEARAVVSSAALTALATSVRATGCPGVESWFMIDGAAPGWSSYEAALDAQPVDFSTPDVEGDMMLYSSGTTGRPKGIRRPLTADGAVMKRTAMFLRDLMDFRTDDVYLSPAPLYHTAPLSWTMGVHRLGGTVVVMTRFDAHGALDLIERHQITHSQWVPTMFIRLLEIDEVARTGYDLSSHRAAVHAAAPCPVPIKQSMIDWWGPILYEYYSGTEGAGVTFIDSTQWLSHPGSVGRPVVGGVHILDDSGHPLPTGETGDVFFSGSVPFSYFRDDAKTQDAWRGELATLGDVGHVDEDGYLYLTDRRSHMIIAGGVNIYPQEAENVLVTHPRVSDVAVFGIPHPEYGEEVKAVVQLVDGVQASAEVETELLEFCRASLARYKCPRTIDFTDTLPRSPTGKLVKRTLVAQYRDA